MNNTMQVRCYNCGRPFTVSPQASNNPHKVWDHTGVDWQYFCPICEQKISDSNAECEAEGYCPYGGEEFSEADKAQIQWYEETRRKRLAELCRHYRVDIRFFEEGAR